MSLENKFEIIKELIEEGTLNHSLGVMLDKLKTEALMKKDYLLASKVRMVELSYLANKKDR